MLVNSIEMLDFSDIEQHKFVLRYTQKWMKDLFSIDPQKWGFLFFQVSTLGTNGLESN